MSTKRKNNKGFTLVELIVVLVILAILAAILVPALLGYIDRAKNQQYITEARELVVATQAGIAEAYATRPNSFVYAVRGSVCKNIVKEDYGYFSNHYLCDANDGSLSLLADTPFGKNDKGDAAKRVIAYKVTDYADSFDYKFRYSNVNNGEAASSFTNEAGFFIMFNNCGKIVYMQYARDGKLVTFDGKSYEVDTSKDAKFITYRN